MEYDIGLIIKKVLEFDAGIPKFLLLGISVIACGAVLLLYLLTPEKPILLKRVSWSMFLIYLLLVLCFTIIFRERQDVSRILLKPIWEYKSINYTRLAESILNILLFIPLGFLSCAAIKQKSLLKVMGLCCGISVWIELLQLTLKKGVCNIDDVINNTVGIVIGYGFFMLCYLASDKTKKLNN